MAKYEVLNRKHYLVPEGPGADGGPRLFNPGDQVVLSNEFLPGENLKPLDAAARAARDRKVKLDAERKAEREREKAAKVASWAAGITA
jgi:hypothetical protein